MKISVVPSVVSAACLSLFSSCTSLPPSGRKVFSASTTPAVEVRTLSHLSKELGSAFPVASDTYRKLLTMAPDDRLAHQYLVMLSAQPKARVVLASSSIFNSQAFSRSTVQEKLMIVEILSAAMTEARAVRFARCFSTKNCAQAMHSRDLMGGRQIDSLHKLATDPIYQPLESQRGAMIAALLEHACRLRPLDQGGTQGCGPVACLIYINNAAEITRLVQGLAMPQGEVRMGSGRILHRCESSVADNHDAEQGSALRIISASLLDRSNGALIGYTAGRDINHICYLGLPGMLGSWGRQALDDLSGRRHQLLDPRKMSVDELRGIFSSGQPVVVLRVAAPMDWHWIVVRAVKNDWVYYQDPNGSPYSLKYLEAVAKSPNARRVGLFDGIERIINRNAEKRFPAQSVGPPLDAVFKVPLQQFRDCARTLIIADNRGE